MDPLAQIGWRSCRAQTNAVGVDLVRDVFAPADEMHTAMSVVQGNAPAAHDTSWHMAGAGKSSASHGTKGSRAGAHDMDVHIKGERTAWGWSVAVNSGPYKRKMRFGKGLILWATFLNHGLRFFHRLRG